jgi:hypothetical protein
LRVLLETIDLAKLRAVDAEALNEIGHYLPALYFAFNASGDTVSTDFSPTQNTKQLDRIDRIDRMKPHHRLMSRHF